MPPKFRFTTENDEHSFTCNLKCVQCAFTKISGGRCKKKTCIGTPYCWIHLLYSKNLRIKESKIRNAGKGLFAMTRDKKKKGSILFRKGQMIIEYDGQIITKRILDMRYLPGNKHTAPYAIVEGKHIEDAACRRGVGSMANHGVANQRNAKLAFNKRMKKMVVKATKNIRDGHEILVNYGKDYQIYNKEKHSTK